MPVSTGHVQKRSSPVADHWQGCYHTHSSTLCQRGYKEDSSLSKEYTSTQLPVYYVHIQWLKYNSPAFTYRCITVCYFKEKSSWISAVTFYFFLYFLVFWGLVPTTTSFGVQSRCILGLYFTVYTVFSEWNSDVSKEPVFLIGGAHSPIYFPSSLTFMNSGTVGPTVPEQWNLVYFFLYIYIFPFSFCFRFSVPPDQTQCIIQQTPWNPSIKGLGATRVLNM